MSNTHVGEARRTYKSAVKRGEFGFQPNSIYEGYVVSRMFPNKASFKEFHEAYKNHCFKRGRNSSEPSAKDLALAKRLKSFKGKMAQFARLEGLSYKEVLQTRNRVALWHYNNS